MTRRCEISGKSVMSGNNVSHSNRKTRRRYLPNLQVSSFKSDILGNSVNLRVAASTIRTIEKNGGLDAYLIKAKNSHLSEEAISLKKKIKKKLAAV